MPYLIPNDWDRKTWQCIRLQWPNSPAWNGILRHVFYQWSRGRTWDRSSGLITDAQGIGYEILAKNYPFNACERSEAPPESGGGGTGDTSQIFETLADWDAQGYLQEYLSMTSGPCPPLKIEGGKLYWWACCEWNLIGDITTLDDVSDVYDDNVPPGGFSACARAEGIASMLLGVGESIWDERNGSPVYTCRDVYRDWPQLSGGCSRIMSTAVIAASLDAGGYSWADLSGALDWQRFKCLLEVQLAATDGALTDAEWNAIQSSILTVFSERPLIYAYFAAVREAIGRGDLSNAATLNAGATTYNCDCPGVYESLLTGLPTWLTWSYEAVLPNGVPDWLNLAGESEWRSGIGVVDVPAATGTTKPGVKTDEFGWPADTDIEWIAARWLTKAGSYVGNDVRLYSSAYQYFTGYAPDTNPTTIGTFVHKSFHDYSPSQSNDWVQWDVEMNTGQGDDESYMPVLLAVAIAGTGTGPGW